jgi:hypothetical protein
VVSAFTFQESADFAVQVKHFDATCGEDSAITTWQGNLKRLENNMTRKEIYELGASAFILIVGLPAMIFATAH